MRCDLSHVVIGNQESTIQTGCHSMLDCLLTVQRGFNEVAVDSSLYDCKASSQLIAAFARRAIRTVYAEDDVLFNSGEPGRCVYLVLVGEVSMFLPLNSMDGMGFRACAGTFVGLPAAFTHEPYSMSAVARRGSELAVMGCDKFCQLVSADSVLAFDVLRILAVETRVARITIVEAEIGRRKQLRIGS